MFFSKLIIERDTVASIINQALNCPVSSLQHKFLGVEGTDKGEIELSGIAPFDMVVRVEVETGISGDGWSSYELITAGTNIDDFGHDMAVSNAQSFGYMEDDEEDEERGFSEDDLYGSVYWYSPSVSGSLTNGGDPLTDTLKELSHAGMINLNLHELFCISNQDDREMLIQAAGNL